MLHRLRNSTTITVYVTACDLEKSFIFKETVGNNVGLCIIYDVFTHEPENSRGL